MNKPESHATSTLARLQQFVVLSILVGAGLWGFRWWPDNPVKAVLGSATIVLLHVLVLALQFGLMVWVNRRDPAPPIRPCAWLRAWWDEVRVATLVFGWRQPFRWRLAPDTDVAAAPAFTAAVFVHGFVCNRGMWLPWMRVLRERGIPYTSVNLEPVFGSIDDYVPLIDDAVRRAHALTGRPPALVCHSMGGLAARAWLAVTPNAAARVSCVITIGTPHHGTWLASLSHTPNGRQMRVDGEWLQRLRALEANQSRPPFVCWYSNGDNIVFPASTAILEGADNRHLDAVPHVAMAYHPTVMVTSLAMLASADSSPFARTAS